MASSIILRTVSPSSLLNYYKFIQSSRCVAVAPNSSSSSSTTTSTVRSFSNGVDQTRDLASESEQRSIDIDRRSDQALARRRDFSPGFFSPDVFDPFYPTRSLTQVLNLMDLFMDDPFLAASRGMGAGSRRGWDVKEDEEKLCLRMDMPGLDKDDVKVSVEQNTLIIKGEGEQAESEEEESRRSYSSRIELPPNLFKIEEIKAEMKNGVLKVIVPKVKPEERKDVFQVKVE